MEHKNNSLRFMAISGWALSLILVCIFIANGAWVTPTANPPGENISAPVNVGSSNQIKAGSLTLNGDFTASADSLFRGNTTFTPIVNNANQFTITDAIGNNLLKIDSTNNVTYLNGGTASISLNNTGADIGGLSIGANSMNFGAGPGYSLGIGMIPVSDNLAVDGSVQSTGQIKSDSGFCIGASCINTWPIGGGGGYEIPRTTIVLSEFQWNMDLEIAGFMPRTYLGMPLYVNAEIYDYGPKVPFYLFEKF